MFTWNAIFCTKQGLFQPVCQEDRGGCWRDKIIKKVNFRNKQSNFEEFAKTKNYFGILRKFQHSGENYISDSKWLIFGQIFLSTLLSTCIMNPGI